MFFNHVFDVNADFVFAECYAYAFGPHNGGCCGVNPGNVGAQEFFFLAVAQGKRQQDFVSEREFVVGGNEEAAVLEEGHVTVVKRLPVRDVEVHHFCWNRDVFGFVEVVINS